MEGYWVTCMHNWAWPGTTTQVAGWCLLRRGDLAASSKARLPLKRRMSHDEISDPGNLVQ
jgi:hypothetical protein